MNATEVAKNKRVTQEKYINLQSAYKPSNSEYLAFRRESFESTDHIYRDSVDDELYIALKQRRSAMASRNEIAKPTRSSVKTNPTDELRKKLNYYYRSQDRLTSPRNS